MFIVCGRGNLARNLIFQDVKKVDGVFRLHHLLEKNTFLWYPAFLKFACETQQIYFF